MEKRSTFGIDEKVLIVIVRAAELFKRKTTAITSLYGLSFSQYNAMRVLEIAGDGRLSLTEISRSMLTSAPNLSGIAKRLEKGGFAARTRDETDERKTFLRITPKGRRVLAEIEDRQKANIREIMKDCPPDLKAPMLEALKAILNRDG